MGDAAVLRDAETAADYAAFGALCREYLDWCRRRYADMPWFVDEVFGHQALDAELPLLSVKYAAPQGRTILALAGADVVAAGAYRRRSDTTCELKRFYVADRVRGLGLGRELSAALIAAAQTDGFTVMQLDTAGRMTEARGLYAAMGFGPVAPYQTYPDRLMPHLVFMARAL